MARRRYTKGPKRKTTWDNGIVNQLIGLTTAVGGGTQVNRDIVPAITDDDASTVVRIVGEIDILPNTDDTDFLVAGRQLHVINLGIQYVGRRLAAAGTPRNPDRGDDRQGKEWLWMGHYTFGWHMYPNGSGPTTLDNWFVPTWNVGGYNPHIDVRVARKLDVSQDAIVLSIIGCRLIGADMNFSIVANLRPLIMHS